MSDLWLGLLLTIPLSLAINLVTGPVQIKLSQFSQRSSARRAERDAAFAEKVKELAADRAALHDYLLAALIRIAWVSALFGLVTGILFFSGSALNAVELVAYQMGYYIEGNPAPLASTIGSALGTLVGLLGTLVVLNIARDGLQTHRRVKDYRDLI